MKQPYTYTLPGQFLADQNVPARWRVWAVINGFFITGQKCWASNEWIGEKIGAHKDTASQAVKELETMGIIRCERGARSRSIYPMIGDNAYQWSAPTPISDRHQRLSISVSNSESIKGEVKTSQEEIIEVREDQEKQVRPKKDTSYRSVFSLWGKYPLNWNANTTEIKSAQNLLFEHGIEKIKVALAFYEKFRSEEWCPQILKPSDLDRKWVNLQAFRDKI